MKKHSNTVEVHPYLSMLGYPITTLYEKGTNLQHKLSERDLFSIITSTCSLNLHLLFHLPGIYASDACNKKIQDYHHPSMLTRIKIDFCTIYISFLTFQVSGFSCTWFSIIYIITSLWCPYLKIVHNGSSYILSYKLYTNTCS